MIAFLELRTTCTLTAVLFQVNQISLQFFFFQGLKVCPIFFIRKMDLIFDLLATIILAKQKGYIKQINCLIKTDERYILCFLRTVNSNFNNLGFCVD